MSHDVILLSSSPIIRAIGSYRIRTVLERQGYRVKLIDFADSANDAPTLKLLLSRYCTSKTKMIGISTTFWMQERSDLSLKKNKLDKLEKICEWIKIKWPHIKIVLGGARTLEMVNTSIDYVVSGYADNSVLALMDCITDKSNNLIIQKSNACDMPLINSNKDYKDIDIDNIYTVWKKEDHILPHEPLPIEIARGCIFKCAFCAYPLNGKKKFDYIRTVDSLVQEFQYNYENFGTIHYDFMDDTYNDSEFKLNLLDDVFRQLNFKITFCTYIKPELLVNWPHHVDQLHEQGFQGATMGIESLNPKTRAAIQKGKNIDKILKGCSELSQFSYNQSSLIFGLPHESIKSIRSGVQQQLDSKIFNRLSIKALGIYHPEYTTESIKSKSLIDQNPGKYGYDIDLNDKTYWPYANWKNDYTCYEEARELRIELFLNTEYNALISSWDITKLKFVDMNLAHHIENKTIMSTINPEIREKRNKIIANYHKNIWYDN